MDVGWLGRVKVEHQNGRRDGEQAVAERGDAAHLAAGQSIIVGLHGATIASGMKRVNPARSRPASSASRQRAV